MTKRLQLLMIVLCSHAFAIAQTRQLSGTITDSKSHAALPGVSISVKGKKIATTTNSDGRFSLQAPTGPSTLLLSSVGYSAQSIEIQSDQTELNIVLDQSGALMDEVVVTALGIRREKKALTYASQTVGGDELRKAANINFVDAISGKAVGIDIKTSNSGAGGSTKAVLRGNKSLLGLSEALYVIDGVPMVNNKGSQPGSYGGADHGDGLATINPEDIESLNILRGANAAILYGSQGANGVILISLKKGKVGKGQVNISSSTIFDQVSGLPDFQYEYGGDGSSVYNWSTTKGNYQKGYIKDFFKTGMNTTNSVSISGGNDKTTAYFSYANVSATGVMPTDRYSKNNVTFSTATKLLNDKLTVSSNVIFFSDNSHNRPVAGYYNNPLTGLYLFNRQRDFADYKNHYEVFDSARNLNVMNWYSTEEKQNNPFWEINKDPRLARTNRVIANAKLSYELTKNLKFETRGNIDYAEHIFDYQYAAGGNSVSVSPNGAWGYARYNDRAFYADAILNYSKTFSDLSLTAVAGASYQKNIFNDGMYVTNGGAQYTMQYPNVFTFANLPYQVVFNKTENRVLKQGVFADVTLGFRDMLFLDVSGRNDWASTLALTGNQSYLYNSFGLTAIVSQMIRMPDFISFAKVRGSLSKTANEVPFNVVNPLNNITGSGDPNGPGSITYNSQVPFTTLKPESIKSDEYGAELKFFNNRAGLEVTYYKDISTNQFLSLPAPSGSGYTTYFINAGKIVNQGFEIAATADVIRSRYFEWKTTVNFSRNKNHIEELLATNPDYQVGGDDEGFASIVKAGGSFNDVYIYKFARDASGAIILDGNGVPTKAATQEKVGNVNPDYLLGFNNAFTYKNFSLNILINGKFGGVAFSKTEAFLDSYGASQRTADARKNPTIPINAVQGGTKVTEIDPVVYYSAIGDRNKIMEPYVYSRTNVRLGQFVLGYNFRFNANSAVKNASISLIGRNLFFFYKKAPFDPEQAMSTSNALQSTDVFGVPATRSYGFNFKLAF